MAKVTNKDRYGNIIDIDQMLKKFKREVDNQGIIEDLKKHEFFAPKSVRRREKSERYHRLMAKLNKKRAG